ncbi:MAG: NUDIX domain-containing protein [Patescibacteria group bacterium]|nr:NUDIX domain-containing protein [Patescibacteria group bacterium]
MTFELGNRVIRKAAGIIVKDRKLLLFKGGGKDTFVAPGGKPEGNETITEALARELKEEVGIVIDGNDLEEFGTFSAEAATKPGYVVKMETFIVKSWQGEIKACEEGSEILWINSQIPKDIKVGSIFAHEVTPRLKERNLID